MPEPQNQSEWVFHKQQPGKVLEGESAGPAQSDLDKGTLSAAPPLCTAHPAGSGGPAPKRTQPHHFTKPVVPSPGPKEAESLSVISRAQQTSFHILSAAQPHRRRATGGTICILCKAVAKAAVITAPHNWEVNSSEYPKPQDLSHRYPCVGLTLLRHVGLPQSPQGP